MFASYIITLEVTKESTLDSSYIASMLNTNAIQTLDELETTEVSDGYVAIAYFQDGELLIPAEETEDAEPDEVVILQVEKTAENSEDDEETYVSVEDENVLNAVFEIFKDKFKDEFNFVD